MQSGGGSEVSDGKAARHKRWRREVPHANAFLRQRCGCSIRRACAQQGSTALSQSRRWQRCHSIATSPRSPIWSVRFWRNATGAGWRGSTKAWPATGRAGRLKLAAVADALAEWFAEPGFRGCAFINTSAELAGHRPREHAIVLSHKKELQERLAALARADGLDGPEKAGQLALLIVDGAIVRAQMSDGVRSAQDARHLLEALAASRCAAPFGRSKP